MPEDNSEAEQRRAEEIRAAKKAKLIAEERKHSLKIAIIPPIIAAAATIAAAFIGFSGSPMQWARKSISS